MRFYISERPTFCRYSCELLEGCCGQRPASLNRFLVALVWIRIMQSSGDYLSAWGQHKKPRGLTFARPDAFRLTKSARHKFYPI